MAVSIYDIAKAANVAPSTVSRALQDHPRIGSETKERIQKLAQKMGYIPSAVARSLVANQTWTIGMVLASISDPFMGRVAEGVEDVAIQAGYTVIISTSQNDRQRELALVEVLQQRRVDGLIVMASHLFDPYGQVVDHSQIPIVVINEQNPGETIHSVAVDDERGAQLAVEHLIALGHRHIGYVGVNDRPQSNQYRLSGYQAALQGAGIALDDRLVFFSETIEGHSEQGAASLDSMLAASATAVFCYNDMAAIGLLAACHDRGLAVPADLSIIGFDDIDIAVYTHPPLTTVHQPRFKLGQQAMQMMLELLAGKSPANRVLASPLVVRQTTAGLDRRRS